jgi:hypothetical protein
MGERMGVHHPDSQQHDVTGGWTQFLSRYAWSHFLTLTVESEASASSIAAMGIAYIRRLRQSLKPDFWFFWTVEVGDAGDKRPHIHMLIGGLDETHLLPLAASWHAGVSTVAPFDRGAAGIAYVVKELGAPEGREWGIDPRTENKERRWKRRCRRAARIAGSQRARIERTAAHGQTHCPM